MQPERSVPWVSFLCVPPSFRWRNSAVATPLQLHLPEVTERRTGETAQSMCRILKRVMALTGVCSFSYTATLISPANCKDKLMFTS